MKKFLSTILALVLTLSLGVTIFAANTNPHNIIINNESAAEHSYEAYQVFKGDFVDPKLTNIEWGAGVNGTELLTALQAADTLYADCETAEDVANVLSENKATASVAETFADVVGEHLATAAGTSTATAATTGYTYTIPVTGDGYYFIKDASDPELPDDADFEDSLTDYILQVVGDVEVDAKSDTVKVEKKVATGGYACGNTAEGHTHDIETCGLEYADDNKAEIGDIVSYKVASTIPAEAKAYDYYYFIIGDTLSDGLTFDPDSVKVTIGDAAATSGTDYTVKQDYDGYTFAVALVDAKANYGKEVVVTYEATVNEGAVLGAGGNKNEVNVDFSRNPNNKYGGGNTPGDTPEGGFPAEGGVKPDGKTPKDITKTYVTKLQILKVDGKTKEVLEGATFAVSGTTESVIVRTKDVYTEAADGTFYKLADGSYTETAPVAEHMEEQTDRTAGGYVECDATDPKIKYTLGGKSYREATTEEMGGSVALYKHIASNEALYDSITKKYSKDTQTVYECSEEPYSFTGTTGADGTLNVKGLNAGTYTITELIAPEGYNLLKEPIEFTITCDLPDEITDGTETCEWIYSEGDIQDDGTVQITIENNSGIELPSTGGIGTTIFYTLGAILFVGASIGLIIKKRMSVEG